MQNAFKFQLAPIALLAGLILTTGGISHADNLVQNGGFETGDFTDWNESGANSGVYDGFASDQTYVTIFGADASSGQVDDLSQSLATKAGQKYTISFDASNFFSFSTPNSLVVDFGGKNLASFELPENTDNTLFTYTATATSSNTLLAFAITNNNAFTGLDNVSVTATPEAGTYASFGLMLTAFGAMALRSRKVRGNS